MRELAQGAAEGVVLFVVSVVLEVVALADLVFAMRGVGFVGVKVDFAEESFFFVSLGGLALYGMAMYIGD